MFQKVMNASKKNILLRWMDSKIRASGPLVVSNAYGPEAHKIMVVVAFGEVLPPPSTRSYHIRAQLSSPFPARLAAPPPSGSGQLLVGHCVDQRHLEPAMIQRPAHTLDVAVLPQQLHRVNLTGTVRCCVGG